MDAVRNLVFVVIIIFASTGCAVHKTAFSGFLKDYSLLQPDPEEESDLIFVKDSIELNKYNKVMIEHVSFHFSDEEKYDEIDAEELVRLADVFHEVMAETLEDAYPLVDEPGPGVLRIRPAITDLVSCNPALNTLTTISPVGLTLSLVKKGMTGSHANVGGACWEGELLDSETNERLVATMDTKMGDKYKIIQGMRKWGHAEDAFQHWANWLRQMLDEAHGIQS